MTTSDEDVVSARIEIIHGALSTLSRVIGRAMDGKGEPTPEDAKAALDAGLTLANSLLVAVTEIAYSGLSIATSVGKVAEIMDRDFQADVSLQAEVKADAMAKEKTKRSFIGNPAV